MSALRVDAPELTHNRTISAPGTRPLVAQLQHITRIWADSQHQLVILAAAFADSHDWVIDGSPTAAHWLAHTADVETRTAREWIRIGRKLAALSAVARHPTTRQKRVVKERDRNCTDCGRADLLEYDHNPDHKQTGHTLTTELELRCAPCHKARHSG